MSRVHAQYIGAQIAKDIELYNPILCVEYEYVGTLPGEFMVYDIISDIDATYYSGKRSSTDFLVQFTYYVSKENAYKIGVLPESFEQHLIELGYIPQGNRRVGHDELTGKEYWQKDYLIRERRT